MDGTASAPDIEELTEQECWHLLRTQPVGRLAVALGHHPDVFPVNFALDGRTVVIRTEGGTKLAGAVLAPEVAFEVDHVDEITESGWSVVVRGRAQEVTALTETEPLERLGLQPWAGPAKARWLRIHPTTVTGRRVGPRLADEP